MIDNRNLMAQTVAQIGANGADSLARVMELVDIRDLKSCTDKIRYRSFSKTHNKISTKVPLYLLYRRLAR